MKLRMAKPEDIQGVIDLCNLVFRSGKDSADNMGQNFPVFLSAANAQNLAIAVDRGVVVAHLGTKLSKLYIYGHTINYASIGAVCTHPDYRGKGIASSLQHMILKHLAGRNVPVVAISGGRGLYTRNGAIHVGGQTCYDIDPSGLKEISPYKNVSIQEQHGNDKAATLATVYHRENVRYHRAVEEFPILIKALPSVASNTPALILTAAVNDKTMAYISGHVEGDTYVLNEYAGDRILVMELLAHTSHLSDVTIVKLRVSFHDELLMSLLEGRGVTGEEEHMEGTLRMVDPTLLWESVLPIYDEMCGGAKMPRRWQDLDLSAVIGDSEEVKLLNFVFAQFERTWDGCPIALPDPYGYNYI